MTDYGFPEKYCAEKDYYCYQTNLEWDAFIDANDMFPIDCDAGEGGFKPLSNSIVVSCFRLFNQNAPNWIQNLAISNALALLMSRVFEILVWVCVESLISMIVLSVFGILLLVAVILAGVSGTFTAFVNSWLGFIAIVICPFFIYLIREVAIEVRRLKREETARIQERTRNEFKLIGKKFLGQDTTDNFNRSKNTSLQSAVSESSNSTPPIT
jgi:hypothetical protein